jgi:hypothetical protein
VSWTETKCFIYLQCPSRVCGFSTLCPKMEFGNCKTKQYFRHSWQSGSWGISDTGDY